MASIRKRGKKSWQIIVSCGYDINGKKLTVPKTVKRPPGMTDRQWEKELQKLAIEFERQVETGQYYDGSKMTFAELAELWITKYAESELAPKTLYRYKEMLRTRILPAIGHIKLDKLQPMHLLDFYENLREAGIRLDTKYVATDEFTKMYKAEIKTQKKLMELAGISESSASRIINGKTVMNKTAQKVCKALGKEMKILFKPGEKPGSLSGNTISYHHKVISSILQKGVQWQLTSNNPAEKVSAPSFKKKPIQYYDDEQIKALLAAIESEDPKYKIMVTLLIFTGMRLGELMGLNWSDINFEKDIIKINKVSQYLPGKKTFEKEPKTEESKREITVPSFVMALLRDYRKHWLEQRLACGDLWKGSERLFVTWDGDPMYPYTLTAWFRKFVKRHNLPPITPHGLRHSMASVLGYEGIDIGAISKRLGHAKISTTLNIYTHVFKKADVVASEALEKTLLKSPDKKNSNQNN